MRVRPTTQRLSRAAGIWPASLALATPAARISNAPAAVAATAARLIRLRIATPHFLLDAGCQPTRVTVDQPGSGACHPRRALRGNLVLPTPVGPTLARKQRQRQGRRLAALPCYDKTFNLAEHRCRPRPGHVSA